MKNLTPTDAARTASLALGRSPYSKGAEKLAADLEQTVTTTHTPGKWETDIDHNGCIHVTANTGHCGQWKDIARVDNHEGASAQASVEEVQANAYLIAAAPDLLAALKDVLRYCVTVKGFPDKAKGRTAEQQAAHDRASAAIAKATKGGGVA